MSVDLLELAKRIEALTGPDRDASLDEAAATALGWQYCRISRVGLRGVGGYMAWLPPTFTVGHRGSRLPNMTGPRKRQGTAASLKALAGARLSTPHNRIKP